MKALYERHEILEFPCAEVDKKWVMAKPLNPISIKQKIIAIWHILRGKAIAVKWY